VADAWLTTMQARWRYLDRRTFWLDLLRGRGLWR
jgi:hypothetical protein